MSIAQTILSGLFHEGVEVVTPIRFNEGSHASAPLPHAFY